MATSSTAATATSRRDTTDYSSNAPTAKFLQARIDTLRNTLVSRLENIFAAAMDDLPTEGDDSAGPPLTDTAAKELQIDVESTALIRAAEEIMVLTRSMKELWLFGGLDTITASAGEEDEDAKKMRQHESEVVKGLMEYLRNTDSVNGNGRKDDDMKMESETT